MFLPLSEHKSNESPSQSSSGGNSETLNRTIDASKNECSGTNPFDEDYDVFNSHMTPSCNRTDSEELVGLDMLRLEDVIKQDGDDDVIICSRTQSGPTTAKISKRLISMKPTELVCLKRTGKN